MSVEQSPELLQEKRPSREARREQAVADALRTLIRDLVTRHLDPHKTEGTRIPLRLDVEIEPDEEWSVSFAPSLQTQIIEQCADHLAERRVYQPGRVFCFRCGHAGCDHARAPSPNHVFAGFSSTGEPGWHELPQVFVAARDHRVDALYDKRSSVLTLMQMGKELKLAQLTSFGKSSKAYSLLGQVAAGFFHAVNRERFAVTFQVVECRSSSGDVQLRMNRVATLPGRESWEEWLADEDQNWVRRCLHHADKKLREMEERINAAGADRSRAARQTLSRVPGVMRRFCADLERGHRQRSRRTRHSESRRREQRPVSTALADARKAADDHWLIDEYKGTAVVAGTQHRFHVFNDQGKHVTSFVGNANTLQQRIRKGRWKPLAADAREVIKSLIGS